MELEESDSWLQTILQNHSNQDSMLLALKTEIWIHSTGQKVQRLTQTKEARTNNGEKDSLFNQWCWKICIAHVKNKIWTLPETTHKNKQDELNVRPDTTKLLDENLEHSLT